jgi:hypothetical protein
MHVAHCLQVRDQLMDWLCEREMTVYQTIFSMSGDAAKLDRFERRFAWFKGRLEERKELWAVFPTHWRVPQTLCLTFCKITKVRATFCKITQCCLQDVP